MLHVGSTKQRKGRKPKEVARRQEHFFFTRDCCRIAVEIVAGRKISSLLLLFIIIHLIFPCSMSRRRASPATLQVQICLASSRRSQMPPDCAFRERSLNSTHALLLAPRWCAWRKNTSRFMFWVWRLLPNSVSSSSTRGTFMHKMRISRFPQVSFEKT